MGFDKDSFMAIGISLGIVCAVASGILATTDYFTKEPIKSAKIENVNRALKKILADFDNVPAAGELKIVHEAGEVFFYPAMKNGQLVGIAAKAVSPKGYSGNLTVLLSMTPEGKINTVIVTERNETPGLGTIVTDRVEQKNIFTVFKKSGGGKLPDNKVLDSFAGRDASEAPWKVKKDGGDVESITGATVSSRAVTDAVNIISQTFTENKKEIITKFQEATEVKSE